MFQNRYAKEGNKSNRNLSPAYLQFMKLFPLKAYKNATSLDYNLSYQPSNHILYKPKMVLLHSSIIVYHKKYLEKL